MYQVSHHEDISKSLSMELADIAENCPPPFAELSRIKAKDGVGLRVARWVPHQSDDSFVKGTIVICPGRGEFIEKYLETIAELLDRGFGVVAFDWRGQGRSDRLLRNASKGHVGNFSDYRRDLEALETQCLQPYCAKPWFALGHSMGAAILIEQAAAVGSPFERLVLSAPMIALAGIRSRGPIARLIKALKWMGLGRLFVPGGNSGSIMRKPFAGNVLTRDPIRFARMGKILEAAPELSIGDPTIRWLNAAFGLMRQFETFNYAWRIGDPILILAAGSDKVVDTDAAERFARRLKAGACITLKHSEHEILAERDAIRAQFWAAFDAFIPGQALPPISNPVNSSEAGTGAC